MAVVRLTATETQHAAAMTPDRINTPSLLVGSFTVGAFSAAVCKEAE
jgi:hypothetical protein